MLSVNTAKALRQAGLTWQPAELDFFAIPLPGFEDQVFVITNMTVMAEPIRERLALTFHGVAEWALDHVWVGEALWLPREDQLRELIEAQLLGQPEARLVLHTIPLGYRCEIHRQGRVMMFDAFDAAEAYAAALLYLLRERMN